MRAGLIALFLGSVPALTAPAAAEHRFHTEHVLGTTFDLAVTGTGAADAERARDAAMAEIHRLDAVLSGWRADSELAALNRSEGPFGVSDDLYRVIEACEAWRLETGGAFDPRLGELEVVWDEAQRRGETPRRAQLQAAAHLVRL